MKLNETQSKESKGPYRGINEESDPWKYLKWRDYV